MKQPTPRPLKQSFHFHLFSRIVDVIILGICLCLSGLITTYTAVTAFPTGAGTCIVGGTAVGGSHLLATDITTGPASLTNGLLVSLDDQIMTPDVAFPIAATTTQATLSLTSTSVNFKGFSFILSESPTIAELVITDTTNQKVNNLCSQDISSVTHTNSVEKNQVDLTLQLTPANFVSTSTDITLDITVVERNSNGVSIYYYSQYVLQLLRQPTTVLELMQNNVNLQRFVAEIQSVPAAEVLLTATDLTVFAPWDFYFESVLPQDERLTRILTNTEFTLHKEDLLLYQIHGLARLPQSTLISRANSNLPQLQMANNEPVILLVVSNILELFGQGPEPVLLVNADLEADNGWVHMTDSLLLPPSSAFSIYDILILDPGEFSTLIELLALAGLQADIQGLGPITMFAPNNQAFARMDQTELDFLRQPENVNLLSDVLLYHVTTGVVTSSRLLQNNPTALIMLNGGGITLVDITLNRLTISGTITSTSDNMASFLAVDTLANNGIIHTISEVLIPGTNIFTLTPTESPSRLPSSSPSNQPSSLPSTAPSSLPSKLPSFQPSSQPSSRPSTRPSSLPSSMPSTLPSNMPSRNPSIGPTSTPSARPSSNPTVSASPTNTGPTTPPPTRSPSAIPSSQPSSLPSGRPSRLPSSMPSSQPSSRPSSLPSTTPSNSPSSQPSALPSGLPSMTPSQLPSSNPSLRPSLSAMPTGSEPTTANPSSCPSAAPSQSPSSRPSTLPSTNPSLSVSPTDSIIVPSPLPSQIPSGMPSARPSAIPSMRPSSSPSLAPTISVAPTSSTPGPTTFTRQPSSQPTGVPTATPSLAPTSSPQPSALPTNDPSVTPTNLPTKSSDAPSINPTAVPTRVPTGLPTLQPTSTPTSSPTTCPTTDSPSAQPSKTPSTMPSNMPSSPPSQAPTTLIRVESTFVLYNTDGLTAQDVMTNPQYGVPLNRSFQVFVEGVVEDVQNDAEGRRQRNLRLALATTQDESQRRSLEVDLISSSARIYNATDVDCPSATSDGSSIPNEAICQDAFGQYFMFVSGEEDDPLVVQYTYSNATLAALEDGQLQEALEATAPNSPFTVAGPTETDNGNNKGKGKMTRWYIIIIALACFFFVLGIGFVAAAKYYERRARTEQDQIALEWVALQEQQQQQQAATSKNKSRSSSKSPMRPSVLPSLPETIANVEPNESQRWDEDEEEFESEEESETFESEDSFEQEPEKKPTTRPKADAETVVNIGEEQGPLESEHGSDHDGGDEEEGWDHDIDDDDDDGGHERDGTNTVLEERIVGEAPTLDDERWEGSSTEEDEVPKGEPTLIGRHSIARDPPMESKDDPPPSPWRKRRSTQSSDGPQGLQADEDEDEDPPIKRIARDASSIHLPWGEDPPMDDPPVDPSREDGQGPLTQRTTSTQEGDMADNTESCDSFAFDSQVGDNSERDAVTAAKDTGEIGDGNSAADPSNEARGALDNPVGTVDDQELGDGGSAHSQLGDDNDADAEGEDHTEESVASTPAKENETNSEHQHPQAAGVMNQDGDAGMKSANTPDVAKTGVDDGGDVGNNTETIIGDGSVSEGVGVADKEQEVQVVEAPEDDGSLVDETAGVKQSRDGTSPGNTQRVVGLDSTSDLSFVNHEEAEQPVERRDSHQAALSQFWHADEEEIEFGSVSWVDDSDLESMVRDNSVMGSNESLPAMQDFTASEGEGVGLANQRDATVINEVEDEDGGEAKTEVDIQQQYPHIMGALANSGDPAALDEGDLFNVLTNPDRNKNLDGEDLMERLTNPGLETNAEAPPREHHGSFHDDKNTSHDNDGTGGEKINLQQIEDGMGAMNQEGEGIDSATSLDGEDLLNLLTSPSFEANLEATFADHNGNLHGHDLSNETSNDTSNDDGDPESNETMAHRRINLQQPADTSGGATNGEEEVHSELPATLLLPWLEKTF